MVYAFEGFLGAVKYPAAFNTVRAGSTAPITFDLDGNRGLEVLSEGYLSCE